MNTGVIQGLVIRGFGIRRSETSSSILTHMPRENSKIKNDLSDYGKGLKTRLDWCSCNDCFRVYWKFCEPFERHVHIPFKRTFY
jgi:hypothetical protein